MLDQTEQRIIGVLIEKELTVPDSYPLTEKSLLNGCNQKSNRDPEMSLEEFELSGALMALQQKDWVTRTERDGGRAVRCRHRVDERLAIDTREKAVLAELLLRGPQAPGSLKTRVARMGVHVDRDGIRALLEGLRISPTPLVEQLPRQPRERDARWAHCLGARQDVGGEPAPVRRPAATCEPETPAVPEPARPEVGVADAREEPSTTEKLEARVTELERQVARLRQDVQRLVADSSAFEDPEV